MKSKFRKELEDLINKHSIENETNTPDYILSEYLMNCLQAFNNAVNERIDWYQDIDLDEKENSSLKPDHDPRNERLVTNNRGHDGFTTVQAF